MVDNCGPRNGHTKTTWRLNKDRWKDGTLDNSNKLPQPYLETHVTMRGAKRNSRRRTPEGQRDCTVHSGSDGNEICHERNYEN